MRNFFSIRPAPLLLAPVLAVGLLVVFGPLRGALEPDAGREASTSQGPYPVLESSTPAGSEDSVSTTTPETCSGAMLGQGDCADSSGFSFFIREVSSLEFPANVDSNSPSIRVDGKLMIFNSASGHTYRSSGDSVTDLDDIQEVSLPVLERPGNVWMEALWKDPDSSLLYGWYHFEPADLSCLTAPIIGAAVSDDDGLTWEDRGFVLDSGYDSDCDYDNGFMTGGNGDFDVIVDQANQSFYFLFSNYAGPIEEQGIGVARSSYADRGQPGTLFKYYNNDWTEPGIGGKVTAIFPAIADWKGPFTDAFWGPSVHWNSYLNQYVALINHTVGGDYTQEGSYITFSHDLLNWTTPQKVVDGGDWYPELVGISAQDTSSMAGKTLRLYVHGTSNSIIDFEPQTEGSEAEAPPTPILGGGTTR